jgi:hypothetical protein
VTAERWRQVEEIFHQAASLSPDLRDTWLNGRCTGDAELAAEVRRLLDADRPDCATIEAMIGDSVSAWLDRPPASQPDRVGPWRIVRPLGTGGMGAVYLAARDDGSYNQLAAVKILRPEQLAPGMRERFRQERQILAELDHPNIARLLDGGTTSDGRPFLVLEYVDGVPLTAFASSLSLRDRCSLFANVCDAVAFAHRNLIVHRDLKPANILVDTHGSPKLLDFGIAKLIGVDHGMSASMHAMFTPDYASPEQVRGQPITTATDVYALGAVLFELLTGRPVRAAANRSFADLVRDVTEGEIPLPSRVSSERIPADLDRIVEKALALEPARRYGTADHLAADLRRFLFGRPVEARGKSWAYVSSKFVRRHWLPLAALLLLFAGLAASTAWSLRQAQLAAHARVQAELERDRAEHERQRAELALAESGRQKALAESNAIDAARQRATAQERFHRARRLTNKFLFDVDFALKDAVGATKARQLLVSTALEHFEQMGREDAGDPSLIRDLARAYDRIGDLQGYPSLANLGDPGGAVKSYRKSLDWHRKIWHDPPTRLLAGYTATKLAKTLLSIGKPAEAGQAYQQANASFTGLEPLLKDENALELIRYRSNLNRAWGEYWQERSQDERARDLLSASTQDLRRAIALQPADLSFRRLLSSDYLTLSRSLSALSDWREALRTAEASMQVMRDAIGPNPSIRDQARLIPPAVQLVDVLEHAPEPFQNIPRALAIDAEMLAIADQLVALDTANTRNQYLLVHVLTRNASHLRAVWRWSDALVSYHRAEAACRAVLKLNPGNGTFQDLLGVNQTLMGRLLFDMHDDAAAVPVLQQAADALSKAVAAGRVNNSANLRIAQSALAEIHRQSNP